MKKNRSGGRRRDRDHDDDGCDRVLRFQRAVAAPDGGAGVDTAEVFSPRNRLEMGPAVGLWRGAGISNHRPGRRQPRPPLHGFGENIGALGIFPDQKGARFIFQTKKGARFIFLATLGDRYDRVGKGKMNLAPFLVLVWKMNLAPFLVWKMNLAPFFLAGLLESALNFLLLTLAVMVPVITAPEAVFQGYSPQVMTLQKLINFMLSGSVAIALVYQRLENLRA